MVAQARRRQKPPLRAAKGTRSGANAGDARRGRVESAEPTRHSRKPPSFPQTTVIPADAGTQRKTKHAVYPPLRKAKETRSEANAGDARGGVIPVPQPVPPFPQTTVIPAHAGTQRKTNRAVYPPLRAAKGTRSEANAGDARGGIIPSPPPVPSFRRKPTLQRTKRPSRGAVRRRCPLSLANLPSPFQGEIKRGFQGEGDRGGRVAPFTGEMSEGQRGQAQNTPAISYESGQPHTMIPLITQHSDDVAEICRRHHVKRLEVFGSAAVGDFNPEKSDIDFLVEFDDSDEFLLFQTRRDLTQELESLFNRSVDIVILANVENPYFRTSVENTREPIFEA